MRHRTSSPARALLSVGVALVLAPYAAGAAYAGPAQAGALKVKGTSANKFDPADLEATPNAKGEITVAFTAEGAPHTWENKELGIDTGIVNAGESKTITFKAPPAGSHKIICSLHESLGMVGSLVVSGGKAENPDASASAAPSSEPPASASASASVGAPDDNAPTAGAEEGAEAEEGVPGVAGNKTLAKIEEERAAQEGAVSGFKFFTFVCIAFIVILGAAVLFSTRPRRAGR